MDRSIEKLFVEQLSVMQREFPCEYHLAEIMMFFKDNVPLYYYTEHEAELWQLLQRVDDAYAESDDAAFTVQDLCDALIFTCKVEFDPSFYLGLEDAEFQTLLYLLAEQKRSVYSDTCFEDEEKLDNFLLEHSPNDAVSCNV